MICNPHLIFLGDKIDKNGMGGACSAYGGRREEYTGFMWGNMREETAWEIQA